MVTWVASSIHALLARKEYLVRLEALKDSAVGQDVALKQRIETEYGGGTQASAASQGPALTIPDVQRDAGEAFDVDEYAADPASEPGETRAPLAGREDPPTMGGGLGTDTDRIYSLRARLGHIASMSGLEFERYMASVFEALGYDAKLVGGAGDQGVDLVLRKGAEVVAVQCKNYAQPVGNRPVQEIYAGARYHGVDRSWVVAPEGFTKGALTGKETALTEDLGLFVALVDGGLRLRSDDTVDGQAVGPCVRVSKQSLSGAPRVEKVSSLEKVASWAIGDTIGDSFGGGAPDRIRAVAGGQYLSDIDSGRARGSVS